MSSLTCPYSRRCGGCQLLAMSYEEELAHKQELTRRHLSRFGKLLPILGAANPCYYRNKVEAAFGLDRSRKVIAGTYEPRSHRIVDINSCLNEDKTATAIIVTIKKLLPSFRLAPYDEDARTGFLRHVLVRRGIHTGEVMVVLVTASPVFPSRQNFLKALLAAHPEITTIVQNVNNRRTSVLLGDREQTLYGPGFIRDTLCGMSFRISPRSFYPDQPRPNRGAVPPRDQSRRPDRQGAGTGCLLRYRHHRHDPPPRTPGRSSGWNRIPPPSGMPSATPRKTGWKTSALWRRMPPNGCRRPPRKSSSLISC